MLWLALSLLTAFLSATEAAWMKRHFSDLGPVEMACYPPLYALPLVIPALFVVPVPELAPGFWTVLLVLLPLNMLGFMLHMWAIRESPLSLTMPFQSFTPAFVIFTGLLFLDERLNILGVIGIMAIVAGGYILGLDGGKMSLLGPIKAIAREKGSMLMLGAAFVYGFCAVLGKLMLIKSSPLFGSLLFFLIFTGTFLTLALASRKVRLSEMVSRPGKGAAIGLIFFLHIICHNLAITMTKAAYMIAIKRLNGLFSVIYGGMLFKEQNMVIRLAGATLMAAGAAIISIWG